MLISHVSTAVTVRRAKENDVDSLISLMREFYAESHHVLHDRSAASSFHCLIGNPGLGGVWLADSGEPHVGYVVLTVRYTMEHHGISGYVDDLFVRPPFRRQGVATALLHELRSDCQRRQLEALYVEAGSDNAAALALYAQSGLLPLNDGRRLLSATILNGRSGAVETLPDVRLRVAALADCSRLAQLNHQLIQDEGHRNPMTIPELEARMLEWLGSGEYRAILFQDAADIVAYALFRETETEIHLRQLFVIRSRRRKGIGRRAMALLLGTVWPNNKRLTVSVLAQNATAIAFWRAIGYKEYDVTLEMLPDSNSNHQCAASNRA